MVYSREGTRGRMESMAQTVPSHPGRTSLTFSKSRIRLVATFTSLPLPYIRLLEGMGDSKSLAAQSFLYLSHLLLEISPFWQVIGTRKITLWVACLWQILTASLLIAVLILHKLKRSWMLQDLRAILDSGSDLPSPDGLLINGRGSNSYTFTVDQGN